MLVKRNLNICTISILLSIPMIFYFDVLTLVKNKVSNNNFIRILSDYIYEECWFYGALITVTAIFTIYKYLCKNDINQVTANRKKPFYLALSIIIPIVLVYPLNVINLYLFTNNHSREFIDLPLLITCIQNSVYAISSAYLLIFGYLNRDKNYLSIKWIKFFIQLLSVILVCTILFEISMIIVSNKIVAERNGFSPWEMLSHIGIHFKKNSLNFLPLFGLIVVVVTMRSVVKRKQFDETLESDQTSGNFGTASWATRFDLEKIKSYSSNNGSFMGNDNNGSPLYFPLCNKLTISPPGGGKTTTSSIPILLSYNGPAFVFDVKGELWAVTARYRSEVMGRDVIVIDPFNVTKASTFSAGKSNKILKKYCFNPFDWIPEDKKERDRMINTFAASFIVNEGGSVTHFDDNAKILIRGYIDYIMSLDVTQRNLTTLFHLMSESVEEAEITFNQMSQLDGRAAAAANQIKRVGSDERGSILSTSYRQIDWMGDSNLQETLSESSFNLKEFLLGNMDVFVVLPEDQVQEHNRLVRMFLSILMGMIVQTTPDHLPKKKMLFLLEELAQLGYTPDVEKCIEVLRARGVVVWTVFQTLSQIELFEKPDLFKGAPLKQIFTNDDTKTMEWIQTLGGKKTVLTKTLSTNTGDSKQRFQAFGGSVSSGDGESIHETGVDLIQLNELRELPKDEQIIFLHGTKPIRCKKVRYFEHPDFIGRFDANPLETRHELI
jgi:type IV secretory pathway TraG/TraD family ATPase VirD4